MKVNELLLVEEKVMSSWISEIAYDSETQSGFFMLKDGRQYIVYDLPKSIFERWKKANSKGKFWHMVISDVFDIERIA